MYLLYSSSRSCRRYQKGETRSRLYISSKQLEKAIDLNVLVAGLG